MTLRLRVLGLVASLLILPAVVFAADTSESIEKAVMDKWSKLTGLSAKLEMEMTVPTGGMKADGTLEFMTKDGKELVRLDMKTTQAAGDQKIEMTSSTVFDGEYAYTLTEMMGQKFAQKQNKETMSGMPGGKLMFESLKKGHTLTALPAEKVDDKEVYVLEAKPKDAQGGMPGATRMYISKETGVVMRTVMMDESGKPAMTMNFKNIQLNPKIDAERFKFKAPEGVEVTDMTGKGE